MSRIDIIVQKQHLRKLLKAKVKSLSADYCKKADSEICRKIIGQEEYLKAQVIFCYVGTDREINTMPILEHVLKSGKRLGVPKCLSYGLMEVKEITSLEQLHPGAYGILEPIDECPVILPEEIELACVPCISCSLDGRRLGYGGGFYDRYLPKVKCKKIALCRKELLEEEIPVDEFDVIVDEVITD